MEAIEILKTASQGVLKRVHVNPNHFPIMKKYEVGAVVGDFLFGGHDDNGNQMWMNYDRNVVLSKREKEVYKMQELSNADIAKKLNISEKTIEAYRQKINEKGFVSDFNPENVINWGELSRILSGNRSVVTRKRMPKKHEKVVQDLKKIISEWHKNI